VGALPRTEVFGQIHPRCPGAVLERDRFNHLPVITPPPAPLRTDRTQTADQMGRRRHLGAGLRLGPGGGGRCRRHRLDRVSGLHGRAGPPARRRSTQKGAASRSGEPSDHGLGRSRGWLSTEVHLAADGEARPLAFTVTVGQAGDAPAFETVMSRIRVPRSGPGGPRTRPFAVLADRAYSSRAIRSHLRRRGVRAVIPQPSSHPTRSATACREATSASVRPASTVRPRSSETPSNAASTGPSSGAAWPHEPTNSPSPTRPGRTPPRRHPHLDPTLTQEAESSAGP
jgi:hypothetical protein